MKETKNNRLPGLLTIMIILLLTGCEYLFFERNNASSEPVTNFEYLWDEIDRKYSYFELKGIDWPQVKQTYSQMLYDGMDEEALFEVLAGMMNELRDDHSNLIAPFNISMYKVDLRNPVNYHSRTIEEFYLQNGRYTGAFFHDFLSDKKIAYIRYASFSYGVSNQDLDHILTRYKETEGLILDLRANGGGDIMNVSPILERFTSENTHVGYFITRDGESYGDFSERKNFNLGTYDGIRYEKPVVVLIDRGSYSATTMFAVAAKALQNITLMGDTTGGGGGLPNGGQLPNGWTYRFSISQLLDINGLNFAEHGVPPDINVQFDWSDLIKDEILEKAIEFLIE
ncbi:MAG: S41 family peptidase [Prolixibacteraceae bacterium]|nr:S41 family peptidase [Prolixibacteraceae bacterium]